MIYTYEISLNGSDYVSLYPTNHPQITTEKMADEFIWRDKVDAIKINEALNTTVYAQLQTWWDDSTSFSYTNAIRIKKSGTVKWTFEFGIKQGKINYENKYYEIEPEPVDVYTDILYYQNRNMTRNMSEEYNYVNEDDAGLNEVTDIYGAEMSFYKTYMQTSFETQLNALSNRASDYNVESAFLWNDNYPDGSSSGSTNYISSDVNYLNNLAIARNNDNSTMPMTFEKALEIPKMFQGHWYCASDYVIHIEHVRWFEEQIANSQLDISGLDYYDDSRIFEYSLPENFATENFFFPTDNEDSDWDDIQILYDPSIINYNSNKIDVRSEYDTYLGSDFLDRSKFMAIGATELAVGFRDTPATGNGWTTFEHTGPNCTSGVANGSGNFAKTNYIVSNVGETMDYDIDVTYTPSLTNNITIQGYTGDSPTGPAATTLGAGQTVASLTGDNIRIASTGNQAFSFTLSVTADNTYRIPWEVGQVSTNSVQNNYLSWANILNRWWTYARYAEKGYITFAAGLSTFDSVKYNQEQDTFSFYNAGDIDPMRGITTDYGIGMILSMTRDLETDFITVKLRYNS